MKWVIGSFIAFGLFIGTLVFICVREESSLVSANYYQDELVHQIKMKQQQNVLSLKELPSIELTDRQVTISFSMFSDLEMGELRLARPSNAKLDQRFKLSTRSLQTFPLPIAEKGLYRVTLQWSMHGKEYYVEKLMVL